MSNRLLLATTFGISLLLHGALLWPLNMTAIAGIADVKPQERTRVVFSRPTSVKLGTTPKQDNKPLLKQATTQPKVIDNTEPMLAPRPVIKPITNPMVETASQTTSQIAATEPLQESPQPVAIEKLVQQIDNSPPHVAESQTAHAPPLSSIYMTEEERQHYLATLLAHIESYKYYPRSARKRGIEGHVNVSFSLSPSGQVSAIKMVSGPALLRRAARKAVKTALPLPKPTKAFSESLSVKYRMAFVLQ